MGTGGRLVVAALGAIAGLCGGVFESFFVLMFGQEFLGLNLMTPLTLFYCFALPVAIAALIVAQQDRTRVAITVSILVVVLWTAAL
jgi:hypothetical protein